MTYRHSTPKNLTYQGVTLIELMVTLALIATFLAIATPGFSALLRENQLNNQTTALTRALHYARSQALTLGQSVLICPLDNTLNCSTQNKKVWTQGWLVAVDQNNNRNFDLQNDVKLRIFQNQKNNVQIMSNRTAVAVFSSNGNATGSNRTFKLCHKHDNKVSRKVVLSNSGRNRLIVPDKTTSSERC
ncbi:hypothetical protein MNBD_GAMMA16-717 [hydrothermal vent metagenome]|uniref:General secretion pathway GspH domain-containing protein n=1 Tax=hydrothermal vent metagenome TaxID=652676 RepID=A0A3B0ZRN3_9ZZZZ